ncbi:MAG: four-carbon acid sugar kinase family protein [Cyanobacteriota bacterium]
MALKFGTIGIIADDLTGANDTALQFLLRGCNTQILLDSDHIPEGCHNTVAWAINTESRSLKPEEAVIQVDKAANALRNKLGVDFIYKKIDSTLRGNVASEALCLLESQDWSAAIIVPAFPDEGRTTVGGYHLLRGVPLERTEVARDPDSPIFQSHIPTILANQCENTNIIGHIPLMTVMRGAGPILIELQELIKKEKRLIVIDAVSNIDLEQIVLAMEKCSGNYKILPCGSAGLAKALTQAWMPDGKYQHIVKTVTECPILTVVGSTTAITRSQVKLLSDHAEKFNLELINLEPEQLLDGIESNIIDQTKNHIINGKNILIYSAPTDNSYQETLKLAEIRNVKTESLSTIILRRLADFTREMINTAHLKLILIGGETAQYCCKNIDSIHLQLIDEVDYAIPLCMDQKAQFIITKSGNLGTPKTLVNIMNYIENLEEKDKSKTVE